MRVVAIHGIGKRFEGYATLAAEWLPAMNSGLREAGCPTLAESDYAQVFFGGLFRSTSTRGSSDRLSPDDEEWVRQFLVEVNRESARLARQNQNGADPQGEDPHVQGPDSAGTRARTPTSLQAVLRQLSKSRFFKALGPERLLIADLAEVRKYLHDPDIKRTALARLEECVRPDTRVIVGHSLGSVVAYEALCRHPEWNVNAFVSLGSPLGIPTLVFDALTPSPQNGRGAWPHVLRWTNIADAGDIVALEKRLATLFGDVEDVAIYNGWASHDARRYLTAAETGRAIGAGLLATRGE